MNNNYYSYIELTFAPQQANTLWLLQIYIIKILTQLESIQFGWACAHDSLTGVEPVWTNVIYCYCCLLLLEVIFTSIFYVLCMPSWVSAHHICKEWLFETLHPFWQLKPIWPFSSYLFFQQGVSNHRIVTHSVFFVIALFYVTLDCCFKISRRSAVLWIIQTSSCGTPSMP